MNTNICTYERWAFSAIRESGRVDKMAQGSKVRFVYMKILRIKRNILLLSLGRVRYCVKFQCHWLTNELIVAVRQ